MSKKNMAWENLFREELVSVGIATLVNDQGSLRAEMALPRGPLAVKVKAAKETLSQVEAKVVEDASFRVFHKLLRKQVDDLAEDLVVVQRRRSRRFLSS